MIVGSACKLRETAGEMNCAANFDESNCCPFTLKTNVCSSKLMFFSPRDERIIVTFPLKSLIFLHDRPSHAKSANRINDHRIVVTGKRQYTDGYTQNGTRHKRMLQASAHESDSLQPPGT
jgi:hypothetical protein